MQSFSAEAQDLCSPLKYVRLWPNKLLEGNAMHPIASYSSLDQVAQTATANNDGNFPKSATQDLPPLDRGDTAKISEEARRLLAAKMAEHGAENPGDLTPEQRADVKKAMAESEEISDKDRAALAEEAERTEKQGPPPADKGEKAQAQRKQAAASGDSEEVEDLKDDIEELEEEIEELTGKALHDPDAKRELQDKRIELLNLEAELTLEELRQQMG